ncbi:MAG: DEAD/DEAH box helicase [Clostridia bacterium]|nr:DEAD/DEAH box helicase [Clostridia bacterium]
MKYKAHDYQQFATEFVLEHPYCGLILDMGLGKSVITLTALWDLVLDRFDCGRVLVIAPKRVAEDTWPKELAKWDHLKGLTYSLVMGSERQRREALQKRAFLYIINRENVAWLVDNCRWNFDTIVIDELSSFKSSKAQRFRALKKVRPLVKRVIGLTGTPSPNSLIDLWPQIYLLDMGQRLGRFITHYRERFFVPDKRNREMVYSYKPREGAEDRIYELIGDICISMKATDHLNMPPLISNRVDVSLGQQERKVYDALRRDMIVKLKDGEIDAVNAASLSGKLLQMAGGAVYDSEGRTLRIHDKKLDVLEDLIEAANGKPLLVAYWYKHERDRIQERFRVREILTTKDIDDWNAGCIPVALLHPAAVGHGINLQQGGSTLIWFGLTWSLELYQQTNARLWRQGQQHAVVIQHLVTTGTHDEDVMRALERKDMGQAALIEAVKARMEVSYEQTA